MTLEPKFRFIKRLMSVIYHVLMQCDFVAGLPTVVKLVDKEILLKEREEKVKVRSGGSFSITMCDCEHRLPLWERLLKFGKMCHNTKGQYTQMHTVSSCLVLIGRDGELESMTLVCQIQVAFFF